MSIVQAVGRILALLCFVEVQNGLVVPVTLSLGIQVVKYLSVRAGQGTVEYFLDESFAAFNGFGDVRGAVGVALDQLFVTGFATPDTSTTFSPVEVWMYRQSRFW